MGVIGFVVLRLAATVPVVVFVAVFVFALVRLTPGDPAAVLAGDNASPRQVEEIRAELGLDEPLWTQFAIYAGQLLRGNLGTSYFFNQPVRTLVAQRLEPTLSLAAVTILLTVVVAVPLGTLAAYRYGGRLDRVVMGFSVAGFSIPVFVLGYLLIWIFAVELRWLPVQGFASLRDGLGPFLAHLILPASALAVIYVALVARIARASVLEVLGEDHVRTARAKGLGEFAVVVRHALRNALVPIVTVVGVGVAFLIGGVVVTESVFNIPGLGRLTVDAVLARDYPTIQGVILVFSGLYVLINLLIDLAYLALDPRIRY